MKLITKCHLLRSAILGVLSLLWLPTLASAGFIHGSVHVGFSHPGPPPWAGAGGPPPFVFEIVDEHSNLAKLSISEEIGGLEPLNLDISGATNSDPIIEIIKTVTNNSGSVWNGYNIGVDGGSNSFVAGSASSDKMSLISETPNLLTFGLPSPVANGETVTFDFKILIPSTGPFQFDLSQQARAVPEPGSLALMAIAVGTVGCLRRLRMRRK